MIDPYKLASCPACYCKRLIQLYTRSDSLQTSAFSCHKCCGFEYEKTSNNMNTFTIPFNHPYANGKVSYSNDKTFVQPYTDTSDIVSCKQFKSIRLNHEFLTKGLPYTLYQYITDKWTKSETVVFFKLMCMKEAFIHKSIDIVQTSIQVSGDVVTAVNMTPTPPKWSSITTLDQFIDTPMHQLFEGITKSCIELIIQFFKHHRKWTKFATLTNKLLEVVKSLRLGFCKCETFTNDDDFKTGGWSAESYLGFSRIMVIIMIHVDEHIESNVLGVHYIKMVICCLSALI